VLHPGHADAIARLARRDTGPNPNDFSDLWFYRGEEPDWKPGFRTGHEWMGIVEEVGRDVRTVKKGDRVLAPFAFSDGSCEFCGKGLFTSWVRRYG
jgi:threonine dehydrogenase-like Zn-dependent dehydrogenase